MGAVFLYPITQKNPRYRLQLPDITINAESKSMELALLGILIGLGWFWLDSMSKRERAISLGSELAARFNLQLLDESVACNKVWLARNSRGQVHFLRTYVFDVSANGADRLHCHLVLLGNQISTWHIPPYQQPID